MSTRRLALRSPAAFKLGMERPTANLIQELVALAPQLGPVYQAHLEDNFGELLPHLMMADVTRWVGAIVKQTELDGPAASADLQQVHLVLALLEDRFDAGDEPTRELIAASFLENLWQTDEQYVAIKDMLGPSLRRWLDRIER